MVSDVLVICHLISQVTVFWWARMVIYCNSLSNNSSTELNLDDMWNQDRGKITEITAVIKVSKSRKQILKFSFESKTNENIFVFLP